MDGPEPRRESERVCGSHGDATSGPTLVAIGAVHGNEPAGLVAIERVLAAMHERQLPIAGRFVGLSGNQAAQAADRRYIERDLNRSWSDESCARTADASNDQCAEDREQRELITAINQITEAADGPVIFLDLHSMSGPGSPFSIAPDLLRNRTLAVNLPVPTVLGLEEIIDGTLLGYLCDQGHLGLAIEGGQHDAPDTADLLEACVWFGLSASGLIDANDVPRRQDKHERLRQAASGKPTLVEIKHRHGVAVDDKFAMKPGYANFVPVRKGEPVARDSQGPIFCPRDGLMMLPRYQDEGDDGFFIAIAVSPSWLRVSTAARRARLDRLLHLLPGLSTNGRDRLQYEGESPSRALLGALHLLGYRGMRPERDGLEFFRRRQG